MTRVAIHPDLKRIEQLQAMLRKLIATTREPAVVMALRHALDHVHMAGTYLGDDLLSPEVDDALSGTSDPRSRFWSRFLGSRR